MLVQVGHQDAAPYNAVVDGDRLVGFHDWDIAGPSTREWDLAFSALSWVPLASPRDGTALSGQDLRDA
jgi:Ser/Thr protein kinase RdoA (MazF antagonist)